MDIELFLKILNINSTTASEGALARFVSENFVRPNCKVTMQDVLCPDVTDGVMPIKNVMLSWGKPEVVFCTHLDTVPPYIPPTLGQRDGRSAIFGRGSCDAKGQIISMYQACLELESKGATNFGLLLLAGEETGSYGAKQFRKECEGAKYVIVGEPTDNKMVRASKGTKSFEVKIQGKSFHSGYPQYGVNAIDRFVDLIQELRNTEFPKDDVLGDTTWNVGKLYSDNPQNIVSNEVTCRIYFRTTFASDQFVVEKMLSFNSDDITIINHGGDTPSNYLTLEGFDTTTVSFGSDAPQLTNFENKILCGPGTILVAHTPDEFIYVDDIEVAVANYVKMFEILSANKQSI
jgi:acetylornithine deacetylase